MYSANRILRIPRRISTFSRYMSTFDTFYYGSIENGTLKVDNSQESFVNNLSKLSINLNTYAKRRVDSIINSSESVPGSNSPEDQRKNETSALKSDSVSVEGRIPHIIPHGNSEVSSENLVKSMNVFSDLSSVQNVPRGLYIYGSVGSGKSMLMDMFHFSVENEELEVECDLQNLKLLDFMYPNLKYKTFERGIRFHIPSRRIHFNSLMLEIHRLLHEIQARDSAELGNRRLSVLNRARQLKGSISPVRQISREIARSSWLFCIDEFQMVDIADALLLRSFVEGLLDHGVVVVTTSNRPPDSLYADGINRDVFLPFFEKLKRHCKPVPLNSEVDFRVSVSGTQLDRFVVLQHPESTNTEDNDTNMIRKNLIDVPAQVGFSGNSHQDALRYFLKKLGLESADLMKKTFPLPQGRSVSLSIVTKPSLYEITPHSGLPVCEEGSTMGSLVAVSSFDELCGRPMGAADYHGICGAVDALILTGIPKLSSARYDEIRRFILLIDELYESNIALYMSSDVDVASIFGEFFSFAPRVISDGVGEVSVETLAYKGDISGKVNVDIKETVDMVVNLSEAAEDAAKKDLIIASRRAYSRLVEMNSLVYAGHDSVSTSFH